MSKDMWKRQRTNGYSIIFNKYTNTSRLYRQRRCLCFWYLCILLHRIQRVVRKLSIGSMALVWYWYTQLSEKCHQEYRSVTFDISYVRNNVSKMPYAAILLYNQSMDTHLIDADFHYGLAHSLAILRKACSYHCSSCYFGQPRLPSPVKQQHSCLDKYLFNEEKTTTRNCRFK